MYLQRKLSVLGATGGQHPLMLSECSLESSAPAWGANASVSELERKGSAIERSLSQSGRRGSAIERSASTASRNMMSPGGKNPGSGSGAPDKQELAPLFLFLASSFNVELVYVILKGITQFSYLQRTDPEAQLKAKKLNF